MANVGSPADQDSYSCECLSKDLTRILQDAELAVQDTLEELEKASELNELVIDKLLAASREMYEELCQQKESHQAQLQEMSTIFQALSSFNASTIRKA